MVTRSALQWSVLASLCLASITSHAEPSHDDPRVTVAVEPIFLVAGIVEANVEVELAPHLAVQGIAGYGGILTGRISELGGEANVYVRPTMTGPHFGTEIKYLWGSSGSIPFVDTGMTTSVTERELAIYAGWKWVGWRNVTAVVQVGVARLDLHGDVSNDVPRSQIIPAANFVVGYSF
ncbi:MAG TPA: hypothetical protein VFQ65_13020 [Kofleriaceae bacterium]|nr:hypothetical protein [Kofleriaceae bacterium]